MKKFFIVIEETISEEFEIEAESKEDAIKKAIEKYKSCEFILCHGNIENKKLAVTEYDEDIDEWIEFWFKWQKKSLRSSNGKFSWKFFEKIFVIETNFYTAGGSKLNETARSYKMIAEESKNISNFEFVWITDGKGWKNSKRNLKETFLILPTLYNINDLENGILNELF